jgi:hypothetical protein
MVALVAFEAVNRQVVGGARHVSRAIRPVLTGRRGTLRIVFSAETWSA